PFVPPAGRHQAAPLLERRAIAGCGLNSLCARIDRAAGRLAGAFWLRPPRDQAPLCHQQLAPVPGRAEDGHEIRRRHVVAGLEAGWLLIWQGELVELDDFRPGQLVSVTSAHRADVALPTAACKRPAGMPNAAPPGVKLKAGKATQLGLYALQPAASSFVGHDVERLPFSLFDGCLAYGWGYAPGDHRSFLDGDCSG